MINLDHYFQYESPIMSSQTIKSHVTGIIGDETDDFIGAFNGYVRRPQPSAKGVIAQFYGENGSDADTILSLSMTQFQNQHVRASVYWVKDAVGALKKQPKGYPLIATFESFVKRSIPKSTGMMATLFAPNGAASDSAHELGFSKYLDSFVHVQLYRFNEATTEDENKQADFLNQAIALPYHTVSSKPNGAYKDAAKLLQVQGFFREPLIWAALGGEQAFEKWLKDRPCSAAINPICENVGHPVEIPNCSFEQYKKIPMCSHHAKQLKENASLVGGKHLLEHKRGILLNEWGIQTLCQTLQTPSLSETHPRLIVEWAIKYSVDALLPKRFLNYLNAPN